MTLKAPNRYGSALSVYLLNKPGKSIALTGRIGEIRPVLGQCDALRPEILR